MKKWECTKKDDTTPPLDKAAELFRKLTKNHDEKVYIIATAKESPPEGNTVMCERMKEYLVAQGIPSYNVFTNKASQWNTFGEIHAAYEVISAHHEKTEQVEKVIICGRWFHVWRAWLIGVYVKRLYMLDIPQYVALTRSNIRWQQLPKAIVHEVLGIFKIPFYLWFEKK